MALRLIEVFIPEGRLGLALSVLEEQETVSCWHEVLADGHAQLHILAKAENSEGITDALVNVLSTQDRFRVISLPVSASIPRVDEVDQKAAEAESTPKMSGVEDTCAESETKDEKKPGRISRDEMYAEVTENLSTSWKNTILVILSAVVAAIGLSRSNPALVIGSMVIAPLLGPNVALSLATTLGDLELARRALKEIGLRVGVALLFSMLTGLVFGVDPSSGEVLIRTQVEASDIVVALAAGSAGTLALTVGAPTALIGVMVAVALLPPLVTLGMLLGTGLLVPARGALLLLLVNLICINLSGVITFIAVGVRPGRWYEAKRASRAVRVSMIIWVSLLLLLVFVILGQKWGL
jgi:uncharacterized hydrophobic protein (TIGR00341 family)